MYIYSTITPIDRSSSHTHIIFIKIFQRFFKRWTSIIRPGTRMQIRILYMCKKSEWTRPSLRYVNYLRWIGITLNVGYSKKSKKSLQLFLLLTLNWVLFSCFLLFNLLFSTYFVLPSSFYVSLSFIRCYNFRLKYCWFS